MECLYNPALTESSELFVAGNHLGVETLLTGSTQQCLDSSGTFHRFWVVNQGCKISAGNWRQIEEMQLRKKGEEAEDFGSLESLCQVWKLSTDQHPPHICKILSINGQCGHIIHLFDNLFKY